MNKKFFIHSITIYHVNNDDTFTRINFKEVYFRHNKKSNMIDKRTRKGQFWNNLYTYNGIFRII